MFRPGPDVQCPVCKVETGARCRTLKTGRTTDTHTARYDALYDLMQRRRKEALGQVVMPPPAEVCSCGNRFDDDNLCMISACEQET